MKRQCEQLSVVVLFDLLFYISKMSDCMLSMRMLNVTNFKSSRKILKNLRLYTHQVYTITCFQIILKEF